MRYEVKVRRIWTDILWFDIEADSEDEAKRKYREECITDDEAVRLQYDPQGSYTILDVKGIKE